MLEALIKELAAIEDPRCGWKVEHRLIDVLVIAVCAVLGEAESFENIALYGRCKRDWLGTFLELPNGIPSKDTFRRVFARLNPATFQACFRNWMQALAASLGVRQIAIDGKTLRRSHDRGLGKAGLHLVSAWATANHLTLGQVAVDDKSNEITAIPQLLELLDLAGAIVTIDAMGCQKEIARRVRDGGGHYVLAVKGNQDRLLEDVQACVAAELEKPDHESRCSFHETIEQGHGRLEARQYVTIDRPSGIRDAGLWQDLRTVSMVVSERQVRGGAATVEFRYYIGSKPGTAKEYARYLRGHWGIENSLHWVLDVTSREDRSRIKKENAPESFGLPRRLALCLLKKETTSKRSIKGKRLRASWDESYLQRVLCGNAGN